MNHLWKIRRKSTNELIGYYAAANGKDARERCAKEIGGSANDYSASIHLFPMTLTPLEPPDKQNTNDE